MISTNSNSKEYYKYFIYTHSLSIKTVTWNKNTNGLFDYKSTNYSHRFFVTRHPRYLVRKDNPTGDIVLLSEEELPFKVSPDDNIMLKVIPKNTEKNVFEVKCHSTWSPHHTISSSLDG